jgi:hypothetical protein
MHASIKTNLKTQLKGCVVGVFLLFYGSHMALKKSFKLQFCCFLHRQDERNLYIVYLLLVV